MKQCTTCKFTHRHHSSSITRKYKLLPAWLPLHIFLCVRKMSHPAADGTKLPAGWQHLLLVLDLHLPSRKDNQLTGVFNLEYSHWTMAHWAQRLHKGKAWTWLQSLTGEHVSSVLSVSCQSLRSNSQKVELHVAIQNSSPDEEVVCDVIWRVKFSCTAGSVKDLCRRLNSSSLPSVWWPFFSWRWEAKQMWGKKEQIKAA